ncbi:hypothetical protein, partial [Paenibacillus polymyxa]|uniref:hypothetical protein n=1 Tax=Paenibacillus polymyxa TaxID=1406 RepID=UPI001ED8CA20
FKKLAFDHEVRLEVSRHRILRSLSKSAAHVVSAYTALLLTSFAKQNSLRKHTLRVPATFSVLKSDPFVLVAFSGSIFGIESCIHSRSPVLM